MNLVLISNLLSLVAQLLTINISLSRNKIRILYYQFISMGLFATASLLLKGYSAVVVDCVGIIRNFIVLKELNSRSVEYMFIALTIILGILFNNRGFWGLLPLVSNLCQTYAIMKKDLPMYMLKILFGIAFLSWAVYDYLIENYVSMAFGLINVYISFREAYKLSQNKTGS